MESAIGIVEEQEKYAFFLGSALRNEDPEQFLVVYDSIIPNALPETQVEAIKDHARRIAALPDAQFNELVSQARHYSLATPHTTAADSCPAMNSPQSRQGFGAVCQKFNCSSTVDNNAKASSGSFSLNDNDVPFMDDDDCVIDMEGVCVADTVLVSDQLLDDTCCRFTKDESSPLLGSNKSLLDNDSGISGIGSMSKSTSLSLGSISDRQEDSDSEEKNYFDYYPTQQRTGGRTSLPKLKSGSYFGTITARSNSDSLVIPVTDEKVNDYYDEAFAVESDSSSQVDIDSPRSDGSVGCGSDRQCTPTLQHMHTLVDSDTKLNIEMKTIRAGSEPRENDSSDSGSFPKQCHSQRGGFAYSRLNEENSDDNEEFNHAELLSHSSTRASAKSQPFKTYSTRPLSYGSTHTSTPKPSSAFTRSTAAVDDVIQFDRFNRISSQLVGSHRSSEHVTVEKSCSSNIKDRKLMSGGITTVANSGRMSPTYTYSSPGLLASTSRDTPLGFLPSSWQRDSSSLTTGMSKSIQAKTLETEEAKKKRKKKKGSKDDSDSILDGPRKERINDENGNPLSTDYRLMQELAKTKNGSAFLGGKSSIGGSGYSTHNHTDISAHGSATLSSDVEESHSTSADLDRRRQRKNKKNMKEKHVAAELRPQDEPGYFGDKNIEDILQMIEPGNDLSHSKVKKATEGNGLGTVKIENKNVKKPKEKKTKNSISPNSIDTVEAAGIIPSQVNGHELLMADVSDTAKETVIDESDIVSNLDDGEANASSDPLLSSSLSSSMPSSVHSSHIHVTLSINCPTAATQLKSDVAASQTSTTSAVKINNNKADSTDKNDNQVTANTNNKVINNCKSNKISNTMGMSKKFDNICDKTDVESSAIITLSSGDAVTDLSVKSDAINTEKASVSCDNTSDSLEKTDPPSLALDSSNNFSVVETKIYNNDIVPIEAEFCQVVSRKKKRPGKEMIRTNTLPEELPRRPMYIRKHYVRSVTPPPSFRAPRPPVPSHARELSPSSFPVLGQPRGNNTSSSLETRWSSTGDVRHEIPFAGPLDDSDMESVKSLPISQGGYSDSVLMTGLPIPTVSYARMAATRPACTGSMCTTSSISSADSQSMPSRNIKTSPAAVPVSKPAATCWKGVPTERRHSLGSGPDMAIKENDLQKMASDYRVKGGSQEVLCAPDCEAEQGNVESSCFQKPNNGDYTTETEPESSFSIAMRNSLNYEVKTEPMSPSIETNPLKSDSVLETGKTNFSSNVSAVKPLAPTPSKNVTVVHFNGPKLANKVGSSNSSTSTHGLQTKSLSSTTPMVVKVPTSNGRKPKQSVIFLDKQDSQPMVKLDISFFYEPDIDPVTIKTNISSSDSNSPSKIKTIETDMKKANVISLVSEISFKQSELGVNTECDNVPAVTSSDSQIADTTGIRHNADSASVSTNVCRNTASVGVNTADDDNPSVPPPSSPSSSQSLSVNTDDKPVLTKISDVCSLNGIIAPGSGNVDDNKMVSVVAVSPEDSFSIKCSLSTRHSETEIINSSSSVAVEQSHINPPQSKEDFQTLTYGDSIPENSPSSCIICPGAPDEKAVTPSAVTVLEDPIITKTMKQIRFLMADTSASSERFNMDDVVCYLSKEWDRAQGLAEKGDGRVTYM